MARSKIWWLRFASSTLLAPRRKTGSTITSSIHMDLGLLLRRQTLSMPMESQVSKLETSHLQMAWVHSNLARTLVRTSPDIPLWAALARALQMNWITQMISRPTVSRTTPMLARVASLWEVCLLACSLPSNIRISRFFSPT